MRFETRQRVQGTVEEVERAMLDDRYLDFLQQHHGVLLEAKRLDQTESGDQVRRRIRYRPKPVIASIGPKPVPPEWFAFVETSVYDRRRHELTFTNTPTSEKIAKLMVNTGVLRLRDAGGAQTERTLDGEVKLVLPFWMKPLGLLGEKIIQSEGLKILDAEIPVLNRFIVDVLRK